MKIRHELLTCAIIIFLSYSDIMQEKELVVFCGRIGCLLFSIDDFFILIFEENFKLRSCRRIISLLIRNYNNFSRKISSCFNCDNLLCIVFRLVYPAVYERMSEKPMSSYKHIAVNKSMMIVRGY